MKDIIEISGVWHLPLDEGNEYNGVLYINTENWAINVVIYSTKSLGVYNEFDTITGNTTSGTNITLYKCFVAREKINFGADRQYETYIGVEYVIWGVAFKSKEEVLFHEVNFRFSNLDEWAFLKGFELYSIDSCDFSLTYKTPKQIECKINDNTSIVIYCSLNSPLVLIVDKEVKVTQRVYVSVRHKNSQTFEYSFKVIKTLMNFVSLNIGKSVNLIEISGLNDKYFQIYNDKGDKIYHRLKIYSTDVTGDNYKAIDPRDVLLNLENIKSDFELYITKWFKKSELLQPTIDLYLNTLNYKEMSIELHFLNLVQALESYHRRMRKNYDMEPEEHKLRKKIIIDSAPDKYKDWLKQKLAFSNEPTLKSRLDELTHDEVDYWIFFNGKDEAENFANDVKNTRNYYTHYDEKLSKKALKGEELNFACAILQVIVEYYLLKEIGLSPEFLRKKVIDRKNRLRDIKSILKYRRQKNIKSQNT